jgi:hypothetical protein
MYDADFNTEGFGAPPASPYGVHGMDRSDTNAPSAFPGDVTAADPYPGQITADIQIDPRPAAAYAGPSSAEVFADPNPAAKGYVYAVDTTTGAITIVKAPPGRYAGPVQRGTPAYSAIYSVYLAQKKAGVAGSIQAATTQIASALSVPSASALDLSAQTQASIARMEAARAAQAQGAALPAPAPASVPAPASTAPAAGGWSWMTWALILGATGAAAYYFYRRSR